MGGKQKTSVNIKDHDAKKPLQAIVLAETDSKNFLPLTCNSPKLLLPIVKTPAIEYTLEFLYNGGVEEVNILCSGDNFSSLKDYIENSFWKQEKYFSEISVIYVDDVYGPCDYLRRVEEMGLIKSDMYVLVSSLIVSNFNLKKAIECHKAIFEKNRHHFMTCLMKPLPKSHRNNTKTARNSTLVTIPIESSKKTLKNATKIARNVKNAPKNSRNNLKGAKNPDNKNGNTLQTPFKRILKHISSRRSHEELEISDFFIKSEAGGRPLSGHDISVQTGVLDCRVDLCSQAVLRLCVDNFDYQRLRFDLLKGALESEIEGLKANVYLVEADEYFGVVDDFLSLGWVTSDLLNRWVYPITPDASLHENGYKQFKGGYKHHTSKIALTAKIRKSSLIGKETTVDSKTDLLNCVLGDHCTIGKNCVLENCLIGNCCSVADGVKLDSVVLGNNVKITRTTKGQMCSVGVGAVVGNGIEITESFKIENFEIVWPKDSSNRREPLTVIERAERSLVGPDRSRNLVFDEKRLRKENDNASVTGFHNQEESQYQKFVNSVVEIIENSEKKDLNSEIASVEIISLKLSYNMDGFFFLKGVLESILKNVKPLPPFTREISLLKKTTVLSVKSLTAKWLKVLSTNCSSEIDQLMLLDALLEVCCSEDAGFCSLFSHILNHLYEKEFTSEEILLQWEKSVRSKDSFLASPLALKVLKSANAFFEWLKESGESYEESE